MFPNYIHTHKLFLMLKCPLLYLGLVLFDSFLFKTSMCILGTFRKWEREKESSYLSHSKGNGTKHLYLG